MSEILQLIDNIFINLLKDYLYLGVFIGSFMDVIFPIVPSEIILGLTGGYIQTGTLNPILALIASLSGNLSAASLMYYLGRKYGTKLIDKFGKYAKFTHEDLINAENKFKKGGYFFVFFSQFIPLMRSIITIPAGILKLSYKKYIISIGIGSAIWTSCLIYAGYALRGNYSVIEKAVKTFGYPILGLAIIVIAGLIFRFYHSKRVDQS